MNVWLEMGGRQYYQTPAALPFLDPKRARHGLLIDPGTVRSDTSGETANATVVLDNTGAVLSALLVDAPLGEPASLVSDERGVLLAGSVRTIELGDTCTIGLQA